MQRGWQMRAGCGTVGDRRCDYRRLIGRIRRYISPQLKLAESYVAELSFVEQLRLLEWLAQHIREAALRSSHAKQTALAAMAADPDI